MINESLLVRIKETFYKICNELDNNHLSPTWVIPSLVIVIAALIRFCFYLVEFGKCNYWGIPTSAVEVSERNVFDFIYSISYAVLFILYILAIYKGSSISIKSLKEFFRSTVATLLINVSLFCILFGFTLMLSSDIKSSLLFSIVIHIFCVILSFLYYVQKRKKDKRSKFSISDLVILIIMIPAIVISLVSIGRKSQEDKKSYKLVDNYIVVYENSDKYFLVYYNQQDNCIDINKQKIMEINNIEYEIIEINNNK